MPQEIHLDSWEHGWSFLTAMERDQEVLIVWNGYKCICIIEALIKDKKTACDMVRAKVSEGGPESPGTTFTDDEWKTEIEPRVWNWLCTAHLETVLGRTPPLQIKRITIAKGWTIAVDSRTPHGGAAWLGTEEAMRVHIYAVDRAVDAVTTSEEMDTQDSTLDLRACDYAPVICLAQRQGQPVFGQ